MVPAGWKMSASLLASPDSDPKGTTSSTSTWPLSPIVSLWWPFSRRTPSARARRRAAHPQRRQRCHRAAELTAEHATERLRLLLGRGLVHQHAQPPVALMHVLAALRHRRHGQIAHIHPVNRPRVDVKGQRRAAVVIVRAQRQRRGTRTHHLTRAVLEDRPSMLHAIRTPSVARHGDSRARRWWRQVVLLDALDLLVVQRQARLGEGLPP